MAITWLLVAELALVTAAIPALYPLWVITEQIVFSLILIGISDYLSSDDLREAFAKPRKGPRTREGARG